MGCCHEPEQQNVTGVYNACVQGDGGGNLDCKNCAVELRNGASLYAQGAPLLDIALKTKQASLKLSSTVSKQLHCYVSSIQYRHSRLHYRAPAIADWCVKTNIRVGVQAACLLTLMPRQSFLQKEVQQCLLWGVDLRVIHCLKPRVFLA